VTRFEPGAKETLTMYCPTCGSDAESANFCPECGTDLRDLAGADPEPGVCPECGAEAGDARFCPECGHQLKDAPPAPSRSQPAAAAVAAASAQPASARSARAPAGDDGSGKSRQQRRQAERNAAQKASRRPQPAAPARPAGKGRSTSPWLIWGGFAVAAVVVIIIVVGLGNGGGTPAGGASTGSGAAASVSADTSGPYTELVTRANGLYDQGSAALQKNDTTGGRQYYAAAAEVYAAAWKKQAGDPGVGTDFATALFYSGQTSEALRQVEKVLKTSPDFQTAYLNRGIFLKGASQDATDSGDAQQAKQLLADAKASFTKAVSIDASSDSGQRAAQELQKL
jgi:hypothetical protein